MFGGTVCHLKVVGNSVNRPSRASKCITLYQFLPSTFELFIGQFIAIKLQENDTPLSISAYEAVCSVAVL